MCRLNSLFWRRCTRLIFSYNWIYCRLEKRKETNSLVQSSICLISTPSLTVICSEGEECGGEAGPGWWRGGASFLQLCRLEQSRRWHFEIWPSLPAVWSAEERRRRSDRLSSSFFSRCRGYCCCHRQHTHTQESECDGPVLSFWIGCCL